MNELDLFAATISIVDPAEQDSFLERECAGRPELQQRLKQLICAHRNSKTLLDRPEEIPAGENHRQLTRTVENPGRDLQPGFIIADKFKLLERIGEGGMGEVWVADQLEPIKRRIAFKLIKPGMHSRSVLARFAAERQALAVMDHPNIARVLDAGTSADGRPFFVMELVKGTPITEFCDARRLPLKQRLELFVPVCQATQHAHTKGIIHRDIKPSNVLVALHDERPVPKVIDFGVAKAIGQQLTEKTIYTGFGSLVGTPAYMAPEQATFNQLDIDTRADVYALGVLLYELLAGSPPVEPERLKKAALDEVLRLVRDEEPPRPGRRLSTSQAKANIAATRQSDPVRLAQFIRGELDGIVMKALEKDRNRRYETANGFAADVQRYLAGETVQAVPPSAMYRLRNFARKNRAILVTAFAFTGLLLAAATISFWLAVKARQAEAVAKESQNEAQASAREADHNAWMYAAVAADAEAGRQQAEVMAASLQIDLDLNEFNADHRIGLLRLARTLSLVSGAKAEKRIETHGPQGPMQVRNTVVDQQRKLREFVTAAILVNGQDYASLLPPLTHDGNEVTAWQISVTAQRLLTVGEDGSWTRTPRKRFQPGHPGCILMESDGSCSRRQPNLSSTAFLFRSSWQSRPSSLNSGCRSPCVASFLRQASL